MTTTPKKPAIKKAPVHKPAVARKPKAAAHHPPKAHHEAKPEEQPAVHTAEHKEKPVAKTMVAKTGHGSSFYAVGKRKTAVAQILLTEGEGTIMINKLPFEGYFQTSDLRYIVMQPMTSIGVDKQVDVKAKIHGGGIHAQAEALRHAISRSLIQYNSETRRTLKKQGFLTRDPRKKERKKPGLKRARRAPQFSKR
jgi:small subunit ribosomal protein S9